MSIVLRHYTVHIGNTATFVSGHAIEIETYKRWPWSAPQPIGRRVVTYVNGKVDRVVCSVPLTCAIIGS